MNISEWIAELQNGHDVASNLRRFGAGVLLGCGRSEFDDGECAEGYAYYVCGSCMLESSSSILG